MKALAPVGNVVLVVVDIQGGGDPDTHSVGLGYMAGRPERNARAVDLVAAFRDKGVPVVFIQEVHKPSLVDIGRELDGAEGPHCLEGARGTELHPGLDPRPEEYLIRKRRYSAFFGTELDLVLRGYRAETVVLVGGMTDVCIHYTAVDAHQLGYRVRVVTDVVLGSGEELHRAALRAMARLQDGALVSRAEVTDWLAGVPAGAETGR
ncbi:isochorismatase family cysteine hydrolase [Nocardioides sp. 616]|uniref:cysteine hydrolase family protein n=1 Tax=Nocardioides sp. 616 TaxID=2268090 RepID=UPI000CE506A9|nr:isochorismatase family cysteine hydrolase [Nocardioides sp. 616]